MNTLNKENQEWLDNHLEDTGHAYGVVLGCNVRMKLWEMQEHINKLTDILEDISESECLGDVEKILRSVGIS